MTDHELLELAAKAVGTESVNLLSHGKWNPLQDDSKALWLAVALGMKIVVALGCVRVWCGGEAVFESFPSTDATGVVALRRAIVRAAAAIGQSK